MTGNEVEPEIAAVEGVQQIPTVIQLVPVPAAADARDALLAAIGAEARIVAEKSSGQASAALAELARAYALVTTGTTAAAAPTAATSRTGFWSYSEPAPSSAFHDGAISDGENFIPSRN